LPSEASWLVDDGKAEKVIEELRRLRARGPAALPCSRRDDR